jgi:rRNA N6-adenosine-methyltransferase METTL5
MARMKMKKLEEYLSGVEGFEQGKVTLEQYITPANIASTVLYDIQEQHYDLEGKLVADLGCGCGMLSIGAFILGAQHVVGFEIDADALTIFKRNLDDMEIDAGIDCVQCDITGDLVAAYKDAFDTVIMNPPFGTKHNAGIDMTFLEIGLQLTRHSVYSLHKTSTRDFIKRKAAKWGVEAKPIAQLRYNLPATYKFHKNSSKDIDVDLWRFEKSCQI